MLQQSTWRLAGTRTACVPVAARSVRGDQGARPPRDFGITVASVKRDGDECWQVVGTDRTTDQ